MWWAFVFTAFSFAAPTTAAKEIWSLSYAGETPVASFFDAASGALYVSVKDANGRARLDRVSLEGKMQKKGMAKSPGEPGPMRSFDGKIYWVAGSSVQIVDPKGGRGSIAGDPEVARASSITVDKHGNVFLVRSSRFLVRVSNKKEELVWEGKKITGLFLLLDHLYLVDDGKLVGLTLDAKTGKVSSKEESPFCKCDGLERASSGKWITSQNGNVIMDGKSLLTLKEDNVGHLAYVYRMDPTQDFFVLPLAGDQKIVAYRMPATAKPKKADK